MTAKNPKLNRRAVAEGADYFEDTLNSDHWENFKDSSIRKSVLVLNNSKTQATRTVNPDHLFFVFLF